MIDCGQRIRYAKQCPTHGPVDAAAIVHGYEYGRGQHLVVDADELDALRPAQDRALRLEHFVEPAQVDPLCLSGRSLFLIPDGPAAEPGYQVLHQSMRQRGRVAVGRMVLGGHRQLVLVRPAAAVLLLQVLHYPEQVRACPRLPAPPLSPSAELQLAGVLIDAASGPLDWSAYRDEAAQELRALIEAKLEGRSAERTAPVLLPLLEALQQSVAAVQEVPAPPSQPQTRSPRKRGKRTA